MGAMDIAGEPFFLEEALEMGDLQLAASGERSAPVCIRWKKALFKSAQMLYNE